MKNKNNLTRRKVLKNIGIGLGATVGLSSVSKVLAASCGLGHTPQQTEGPFYPIKDQRDKNNDLTFIMGKAEKALGEKVILKGVVTDQNCNIVKGALVEIWQACASGKYNHPSDHSQKKLDPNFQYWGQDISNNKGEYEFKTIIPGAYPAVDTWTRPPHIHIKVHLRGFDLLTTQVYFLGNKYNAEDRVLKALSNIDKSKVILEFKVIKPAKVKVGIFNIMLRAL